MYRYLWEGSVANVSKLYKSNVRTQLNALLFASSIALSACGGGGSSSSAPPTAGPPPPPPVSKAFSTPETTSVFLGKATFGGTETQVATLADTEVSDWIVSEFAKPAHEFLPEILQEIEALPDGERLHIRRIPDVFLDHAIAGDDQLRTRMVFALSEILVTSIEGSLSNKPATMAHYMDVLSTNAFGNYRELLEDVTYSPAMAIYLTYLRNRKGNPEKGRVPDENYARELMQLFTIGVVELNLDGTPRLDGSGNQIETYTNDDIVGLSKVFTGLSTQGSDFWSINEDPTGIYNPLVMFPNYHSELEKTFLGTTIPAGTSGDDSIDQALDIIFNHPNMAPFFSRQLIQRFVSSNPNPSYVQRVSAAFEAGTFTLPDGQTVGDGRRGDLKATLAAVLLDDEALQDADNAPAEFGKIREPILRFVHWARIFGETTPDAGDERLLKNGNLIGQFPFSSKSVFNFYRPGYVAPGTATGEAGLTAPELQIINESSAIGYINFINEFIYNFSSTYSDDPDGGVNADYSSLLEIADDEQALVDELDMLLTGSSLSNESKTNMVNLLKEIPISTEAANEDKLSRVHLAVSMTMTDPGYIVQR
ncbi:MAG: DUF1800 domain-containing protein [Hyphomonadaceae bacterium]|nr:DUF1800 domain-containing protein [Hyphomonadaceae bacterium]